MTHDDGALIPAGGVTDPASVAIAHQHRLSQATEVFFVLPSKRVAGRTQAKSEHLCVSARTVHDPLAAGFHFPAPATYR